MYSTQRILSINYYSKIITHLFFITKHITQIKKFKLDKQIKDVEIKKCIL